jgi:aspartate racemase
VSTPPRAIVHRVIYEELAAGKVIPASRAIYREVIARLIARGAEAVILGCTEIMLLVSDEDSAVPLFRGLLACTDRRK